MKLSLAPVPYFWSHETLHTFYSRIAESPVDIVYLGETICSKRRTLRLAQWLEVAEQLQAAGKQVVLSSLMLLEAESELNSLRRLCDNGRFWVEANDMAAIHLLAGKIPFVAGPGINIYNQHSLRFLANLGLRRWIMPVELSQDTLADIQNERPAEIETEVQVFGRLPLAISARCFCARSANLPKDDCQHICLDYPEGRLLYSQENEPFLNINGVQLQSARPFSLLSEIADLFRLDVDILRIVPQPRHTEHIIELFKACLVDTQYLNIAQQELQQLLPLEICNGYWHGQAGMTA